MNLNEHPLFSNKSWLFVLFVVGYLAINLPGINAPFISSGEPREALVAQNMILQGNLLESARYDENLATKPPFLHWFMVLSTKVTGEMNEAASRLPSVVAATVAVVAWTLFLIPLIGLPQAILFFLILSTSGEWYRHASHARVDMLLASLVSLSLLALFHWMNSPKVRYLAIATVCMALAALTKGPIGVALPIAITLASLLYWRELRISKVIILGCVSLLALFPLFAWYIAQTEGGNSSLMDIVLHENLDRLLGKMSTGDDPHAHGPFYLIGAFLLGLLPWSLFGVIAGVFLRKTKISWAKTPETKRFLQWCVISVLLTLVVFLIPSSKRGVYLLPCYPAAAFLLTILLDAFSLHAQTISRKVATVALSLLGIVALLVFVVRLDLFDIRPFISSEKSVHAISLYLDVFRLSFSMSSLLDWSLPLMSLAVVGWRFWSVKKGQPYPIHAFALVLALLLPYVKGVFIRPIGDKFSARDFLSVEIKKYRPSEVTLQSNRMYAEAFYARQIDSKITVRDLSDDAKYLILNEEDEGLTSKALSLDKSSDIRKPGKYLWFAKMAEGGAKK
ncbi:MAG: glycosyltransferase family 39 protein [Bdellovibrionales bacterium]|nr:glycosyltransferase family 39 protein [Bdellovibrionales bacterium]